MMPLTISGNSLCSSGSPPAIDTTGAPHSSTACKRVGDRDALVQDLVGIIDLAAAGASQIAAEQRLEHQHQRITLAAGQMLADDVATDMKFLQKGNAQDALSFLICLALGTSSSSTGTRNSMCSSCPAR